MNKRKLNRFYRASVHLSDLQSDIYTLIQADYDLAAVLEFVGVPDEDKSDITGAVCLECEGDYAAVWLTESARPFDLNAIYHPLPFYRPDEWDKECHIFMMYWLERNPEYYF
jgi:hypothetical protein